MTNRKSGFTLMEIMVVIIVIAVLASVAGPMIGSITDQGRTSATKSKLSSLKSALLAYQSDTGRLPFVGNPNEAKNASKYNQDLVLSDNNSDQNVLVTDNNSVGGQTINVKNYKRKWKGPYMDSDPSDFMLDAWGNKIIYAVKGKHVYLWSYGADGAADDPNIEQVLKNQANDDQAGTSDDIVTVISRTRNDFTGNIGTN